MFVGKEEIKFWEDVCRLKSLRGLTIPCWARVVIWGECWGNIGKGKGVGVNVVAEVCCWSWVEGEEDIGLEEEIGEEGWLGGGEDDVGLRLRWTRLLFMRWWI